MESFDKCTIENHFKYSDRMAQLTARYRSRGYAATNLKSKPDKTYMHIDFAVRNSFSKFSAMDFAFAHSFVSTTNTMNAIAGSLLISLKFGYILFSSG